MNNAEKLITEMAAQPVTKIQVRDMILEAQAAWRKQAELGLAEEPFDAWRHGALYDVCRKTSFREVGQHEFGAVLAHFERLAGKEPNTRWGRSNHAIAARECTPEGDRRRAEWLLRQEFASPLCVNAFGDAGLAEVYARSLLFRIYRKTAFADASAKELAQITFTLRSRARAKNRKHLE